MSTTAWLDNEGGDRDAGELADSIRAGAYRAAQSSDTIGARIQAARKAAGLSCAALALAVDVQRMQVYRWEDNVATPNHNRLRLIAKALNVPVGELWSGPF